MILLDTNVLSEALKPLPSEAVLRWLAAQDPDSTYTSSITQAEILYGVELLPAGKRRDRLSNAVERMFVEDFRGRILSFDESAARAFAKIATERKAAGHPISQVDGMIAAIARARKSAIATRDINGFQGCGISLIDPWIQG